MPEEKKTQVFLSYASENLDMVRKVYDGLVKRKLNVWFDKEHLKPGKWKPQIERAIRRSRYFIICLSNAAIKKTGDEPGFQDNELNEAYNIARDQAEQEFTIIPVRLEDCRRGDHRLTLFQQYDLFEHFDVKLDKLAVNLGGTSLSDPKAKDERTGNEKLAGNLTAKAQAEYYAGRFHQSITFSESALILSPDNAEAWRLKGTALDGLGKTEEARQAYEKGLKSKSDDASGWYNKGHILSRLLKSEEAVQAFNQALKIDPELVKAWVGKGVVLEMNFESEKAIEAFNQALKLKPDDCNALYYKGISLMSLRKGEKALQLFDKALKINPKNCNVLIGKGQVLEDFGKTEEALEAFDQALRVRPDNSVALMLRDRLKKQLHGKE